MSWQLVRNFYKFTSTSRHNPVEGKGAMVFIETKIFTDAIQRCMSDDAYAALQNHLVEHPDGGALIPDSGGLRKIRWCGSGRGKRGGTRVIYYWWVPSRMFMLLAYAKNQKDNLTAAEKTTLRKLVEDMTNG